MFATIIHPTDFSSASIPALHTAQELAQCLDAKLIVCFVAHPPLIASGDTLLDPKTNESRNIAEELERNQPNDPKIDRELRVILTEQSTGVKTLLGFLEEMDCDLLVLGMHKRQGVASWFASSITEEVVRRAKCKVMVVKGNDGQEVLNEESEEKVESSPE